MPTLVTPEIPRFGLTRPYLVRYRVTPLAADAAPAGGVVLHVLNCDPGAARVWEELCCADSLRQAQAAADAHRGKPVRAADWAVELRGTG